MFFVRYFLKLASALLSISGSLLFALPQVKCNLTRNFSVFFHFLPCGLVSNLGEGCADRAYTTIPCTLLIVMPFSNGFCRRTLCPSEEFNKLSDCLNSGGVIHPLCELRANTETQWEFFTLFILPLPVKQTFEGFCVACLYFTISKRCLLTGDLNYNHLDICQASVWNNAARLLRTEHQ